MTNISDEELAYIHDVMNSETYTVEEVELCQQYLDKAEYISLSEVYKNNGLKSTKDKVEFNYKNANRIFQTVSMGGGTTAQINESRNSKCKNIFFIHQTTQNKLYIIKGDYDLEKRKPRIQVLFAQDYLSYNPCDLWTDIKTTGLNNEGAGVAFKNSKKPEHLIERIISMSTNPGDLVLDSFLGSGTTAAVAHKMGRRYIGIELGNHCYTHCIPRLNSVIDGTDKGGISKKVNWQGGGGYKFYELAPSLIEKDKYGNPVISNKYNSNMLIAAVAKLNGYNYAPDSDVFWKQGYSQDKSYIYVTTNYMDSKMLDSISSDLGMMETLLICAPAFDVGLDKRYDNIQVKKIPQSVLDKCEYGVDNYNLNVVDIPIFDEEEWEDD